MSTDTHTVHEEMGKRDGKPAVTIVQSRHAKPKSYLTTNLQNNLT